MNPLRLVVVTRRFWPLVGSAEKALGSLAAELAARGHRPMVLTARREPGWPERITVHNVPVIRLSPAPSGTRSTLRYMRTVARWLREAAEPYDLVYVSGLKHEAYAALRAVGGRAPVVLRAEKAGRMGDCLWQIDAFCGGRIKRQCLKATAFVGPSQAVGRELRAAGYCRARIHDIPDGVALAPERDAAAKAAARQTLIDANSALEMPEWAPLALYAGRLCRTKGVGCLVAAWAPIAARWPNARLWLAGEGPDRQALMRQIDTLSLTGRVVPIGVFDEIDDLLSAADLLVLPSLEGEPSRALLEAMAAGLPIVASDIRGHRDLVDHGQHGLLVPLDDPKALSAAVARLLDEPALAARLGAAARQRAAAEFSLAQMVDQHLALFERLTAPTQEKP